MLAGHSFGGLYVLTFAATYPDQVAGLVLLDSTSPKPGANPPVNTNSYDLVGRISTVLPAFAHLGAAHLIGDAYDSLPARSQDEARAGVSTARAVQSYLNEFREGAMSMQQAAALDDFGDKPLMVVTAGRGNDETRQAAQNKLASLSTNSQSAFTQFEQAGLASRSSRAVTTAWVAPARDRLGRDRVLKVGWAHDEAEQEADGLRAWAGQGTVLIYDSRRL